MKELLVKKEILGVEVTDASSERILEYVFTFLAEKREKMYIVTPNPEIITYAARHEGYKNVLNAAGVALCDGAGLLWASRVLGIPLKERISGVDFMEKLCKESVRKTVSVGFLGGRNNVAERTAECLKEKYPGMNVSFVAEEWSEEGFMTTEKYQDQEKNKKMLNTKYLIHNTDVIDILFVAFGFPKQEEWMAENLKKLPVRVMMGVGGSFDYLSGEVRRAPKFVRSLGLEWLFRLIRQPWRLKRQIDLLKFVTLVLKQRLGVKSLS